MRKDLKGAERELAIEADPNFADAYSSDGALLQNVRAVYEGTKCEYKLAIEVRQDNSHARKQSYHTPAKQIKGALVGVYTRSPTAIRCRIGPNRDSANRVGQEGRQPGVPLHSTRPLIGAPLLLIHF